MTIVRFDTERRKRRQRERFEVAVAPLRESFAYLLDESHGELVDLVEAIEDAVPGGAAPHWFALRAFLDLDRDLLP